MSPPNHGHCHQTHGGGRGCEGGQPPLRDLPVGLPGGEHGAETRLPPPLPHLLRGQLAADQQVWFMVTKQVTGSQ